MKKVIFLGYDGLMYEMIEKFVQEGIMPNFKKILQNGIFSRVLPSPPTDTPTNWTSLATGAYTGTHGINTFGVHLPGEPFEKVHLFGANIFPRYADHWRKEEALNRFSQAEYIWQSAERIGKKCILINYPGGWPPNIRRGIVIDGTGPYSSILSRLSYPNLYSSESEEAGQSIRLQIYPAFGWDHIPNSKSHPLETALLVSGEGEMILEDGEWVSPGDKANASELIYNILIINSRGKGYDEIIICKGKNTREKLATLRIGEESKWLWENFSTPYGSFKGKFKLRLLELSPDGKKLLLYRTTIFNTEGWAYPKRIADELIDELLSQRKDILSDGTKEDIPKPMPLCQVYESIEDQAIGLSLTAKYLANNYEWDLLFLQLHAPDGLNHQKLNELCPEWEDYEPEEGEKAWAEFRQQYKIFDWLLGEILANCVDEETLVLIASDHAALPTFKRVWLGKFFEEAGLVAYKKTEGGGMLPEERWDPETVGYRIDMERSKVFVGGNPFAQNIWVNLKGREINGIVEPEDYEKIVRESIEILYSIRDPETGEHPIALALPKREADFLGQWGERVGDVVFYFKPPYTEVVGAHSYTAISERIYKSNGFFAVKRGGGMQGIHHPFLPSARFLGFSVCGIFIASGPMLKRNYRRSVPLHSPDIVPIICHWLGIPIPKQCEGRVPLDIFE
ncbi:MAG: alkaline phosphatase family protein [bacterium]